MSTTAKPCSRCERELPLDAFGIDARYLLGRKSRCRECENAVHRERRLLMPDVYARYRDRWAADNPAAVRAWRIFRAAVERGELVRPERCERCGAVCTPHGHHPDYSRPLVVEWLCVACHQSEIRRARERPPELIGVDLREAA